MDTFNIIFCVLTYKNEKDLKEFIYDLKKSKEVDFTYKIVVVNNYANEESLFKIKEISKMNNCDFIENENKGYSHGNNLGINYIMSRYEYEYLIICNPDTLIKKFDYKSLKKYKKEIIAPDIVNLGGKKQNPMYVNYLPLSEKIVYKGFKKRKKGLLYLGILLNKVSRRLMTNENKLNNKIYACHGSYIIFSCYALEKLYPVFDQNIFLFSEENDLAKKAEKNNVNIIYNTDIKILHKEDGSMNISKVDFGEISRDSYLYYYEKWID